MKRLLFIASLAILAMSCEKTIVSNGVLTPIGFSTEVGKQTRAVVQSSGEGSYPTEQPFAVYAYGHHEEKPGDPIMENVAIAYTPASSSNNVQIPEKWSADGSTKYYWPNDPRTTINFYAYSPATNTTNYDGQTLTNDQQLHFIEGGGVSHTESNTENGGLILSGYKHKNMYVDFMVAAPVIGATFGDQDGNGNSNPDDAVPVSFAHQMTQVNFTVKIVDQASYPNVDFKINRITLNKIYDQANYKYNKTDRWEESNIRSEDNPYIVFPAVKSGDNAAPIKAAESAVVLHTDDRDATQSAPANPKKLSFSTTPVTMIPQAFVASTKDNNGKITALGHSFTIDYDIKGVGVADENVVKTFDLPAGTNNVWAWTPNKKITYVLTISLNEILFDPVIATNWDETNAGFDI